MSPAEPATASLRAVGRLAWTGLWWLIAIGGCAMLITSCLASLRF